MEIWAAAVPTGPDDADMTVIVRALCVLPMCVEFSTSVMDRTHGTLSRTPALRP